MNPNTDLAEIVKFHRKKGKLTQKGLADLAGVGKTVIFDIENGKTSIRFDTLQKVLNVLNIKINFDSTIMNLVKAKNEKFKDL